MNICLLLFLFIFSISSFNGNYLIDKLDLIWNCFGCIIPLISVLPVFCNSSLGREPVAFLSKNFTSYLAANEKNESIVYCFLMLSLQRYIDIDWSINDKKKDIINDILVHEYFMCSYVNDYECIKLF